MNKSQPAEAYKEGNGDETYGTQILTRTCAATRHVSMSCWLAGNSRHIQALLGLARALRTTLEQPVPGQQRIQRVNDFLFSSALDGVNMFKLLRYATHLPGSQLPAITLTNCLPLLPVQPRAGAHGRL